MKTNKENIPIPYTPLTIAPPLFRESGDYIERGLRRDEDIAQEDPIPRMVRWNDEK